MNLVETVTLSASEVERCLSPADCRAAVERAFMLLAQQRVPAARDRLEAPGGFHAKVAPYDAGRPRFVARSSNFPGNPAASGPPTIQGVWVLYDSSDGRHSRSWTRRRSRAFAPQLRRWPPTVWQT